VIYVIWHHKFEYCCHPTSYILICTVATHVDEFDVSEVIESDNEGSYNDGADIGSGVDDDDDEGSNDDGLDFGSDDDADDDEGSSDDGLDFGSDDDDDGGGGGNEEINEDEKR
jgi:hypothetical protein